LDRERALARPCAAEDEFAHRYLAA